jgi:hypothetical protein
VRFDCCLVDRAAGRRPPPARSRVMATVNKVTFMAHPGYVNPNSAVENSPIRCALTSGIRNSHQ